MIRPDKKDYNLNEHFEAIRLARDLMKYVDYLELDKQVNQEQKLPIDLVIGCLSSKDCEKESINFTATKLNSLGNMLSADYRVGYKEGVDQYLRKLNNL